MQFEQTISLANGLMAEGRGHDVLLMFESLLPASDTTQLSERLSLDALKSRVFIVYKGQSDQACEILQPFEKQFFDVDSHAPFVASAMLWFAWSLSFRSQQYYDPA